MWPRAGEGKGKGKKHDPAGAAVARDGNLFGGGGGNEFRRSFLPSFLSLIELHRQADGRLWVRSLKSSFSLLLRIGDKEVSTRSANTSSPVPSPSVLSFSLSFRLVRPSALQVPLILIRRDRCAKETSDRGREEGTKEEEEVKSACC